MICTCNLQYLHHSETCLNRWLQNPNPLKSLLIEELYNVANSSFFISEKKNVSKVAKKSFPHFPLFLEETWKGKTPMSIPNKINFVLKCLHFVCPNFIFSSEGWEDLYPTVSNRTSHAFDSYWLCNLMLNLLWQDWEWPHLILREENVM